MQHGNVENRTCTPTVASCHNTSTAQQNMNNKTDINGENSCCFMYQNLDVGVHYGSIAIFSVLPINISPMKIIWVQSNAWLVSDVVFVVQTLIASSSAGIASSKSCWANSAMCRHFTSSSPIFSLFCATLYKSNIFPLVEFMLLRNKVSNIPALLPLKQEWLRLIHVAQGPQCVDIWLPLQQFFHSFVSLTKKTILVVKFSCPFSFLCKILNIMLFR